MSPGSCPNSRLGWHHHYARRFNKTGAASAETLALWFLLLYEAFGEQSTFQERKK